MSAAIQSPRPTHPDEDAFGLPGWIYHDRDFFELEKRSIFRTSWQLVCHSNDIPKVGDYHRFDLLGESVVTVRGKDGQLRSFHNVCRHRASRLLDGQKGNCGHLIACPYHALELLARRQADRRAAARHRSAASTWRAAAWSRSSRKSSWASCSCASSRACRACARWRRRTPTSSPPIAWKSWCRRAASRCGRAR